MKKNEKLTDGKVCLGVYITAELHAALTKAAKEKDLTLSQITRQALKDYIAKETN